MTDKIMAILALATMILFLGVVAWFVPDIDLILVMTINPGFGGQKFQHAMIDKIAAARAMIGDRPIHIEIDGGVDARTAPLVAHYRCRGARISRVRVDKQTDPPQILARIGSGTRAR